jgi:hypothetical protein
MMRNDEISMTFSGVHKHNDKNSICVRFERGKDYAEGYLPAGVFERSEGFTEEELSQLASYMKEREDDILKEARKLNNIKRWFS